jgi:hypothetical protein
MASFDFTEVISVRANPSGHECAAEAEILVMGRRIGFVGGSRYASTVIEAAEDAIFDALKPLIAAIQEHPGVERVSRFWTDDVDIEDYEEPDDDVRIPNDQWFANA